MTEVHYIFPSYMFYLKKSCLYVCNAFKPNDISFQVNDFSFFFFLLQNKTLTLFNTTPPAHHSFTLHYAELLNE